MAGKSGRSGMTQAAAAARIQSAACQQNGGSTPAGSFAARAQSAAAQNNIPGTSSGSQGNGGGNAPSGSGK